MSRFFDELMASVMAMDEILCGVHEPVEQAGGARNAECEQFQVDLLQSVLQMKARGVAPAIPPNDPAKQ